MYAVHRDDGFSRLPVGGSGRNGDDARGDSCHQAASIDRGNGFVFRRKRHKPVLVGNAADGRGRCKLQRTAPVDLPGGRSHGYSRHRIGQVQRAACGFALFHRCGNGHVARRDRSYVTVFVYRCEGGIRTAPGDIPDRDFRDNRNHRELDVFQACLQPRFQYVHFNRCPRHIDFDSNAFGCRPGRGHHDGLARVHGRNGSAFIHREN